MQISLQCMVFTTAIGLMMAGPGYSRAGSPKRYAIEQTLTLSDLARSSQSAKIYWPLPQTSAEQTVHQLAWSLSSKQDSDFKPQIETETAYQNQYAVIDLKSIAPGKDDQTTIKLSYEVSRSPLAIDLSQATEDYSKDERDQLNPRFLQANRRVPLDSALLNPFKKQIPATGTRVTQARSIFDLVVETMDYKKVGDGWGHGDTHWACSQKYGNCTDFHALFTSLARSRGIPVRFEIGLPIDLSKSSGEIKGYHCWVMFYLPGLGWTPADASEAKKNLSKKDEYFARQPADRILLSRGRDLILGQDVKTQELNYFVFPYLEVDGKPQALGELKTSYRILDQPPT